MCFKCTIKTFFFFFFDYYCQIVGLKICDVLGWLELEVIPTSYHGCISLNIKNILVSYNPIINFKS